MTKSTFNLETALSTNSNEGSGLVWDPIALTTDYFHKMTDAEKSMKPVKYIMGSDAKVYEMRTTDVADFVVAAKKVIGTEKIENGFTMKVPKIPFHLLLQTVSFFRDVCKEFNNDEAMLQYWYDIKTKEYSAICLKQTTNKVHVTYIRDEAMEQDPNKVLVMDIHSHNNMSAFFSGTDDSSEQETRFYGVIGRLDLPIPHLRFRYSVEGNFVEIPMDEIVEMPKMKFSMTADEFTEEIQLTSRNIFFPQVPFPSEWLTIIEEGKKFSHHFSGKGNSRARGIGFESVTPSTKTTGGFDHPEFLSWDRDNSDEFANNGQMHLFDHLGPSQSHRPVNSHDPYNWSHTERSIPQEYTHGYYIEDEENEDALEMDAVVDYLEDVFAENPHARLQLLEMLLRDSSMYETRQMVELIAEAGYEEEIVTVIRGRGVRL